MRCLAMALTILAGCGQSDVLPLPMDTDGASSSSSSADESTGIVPPPHHTRPLGQTSTSGSSSEGSSGVLVVTGDESSGAVLDSSSGSWGDSSSTGEAIPVCSFVPGAGCLCDGMISVWYECFDTECALVGGQCFCVDVPSPDEDCAP